MLATSGRFAALIVALLVFSAVAIGGLFYMGDAIDSTHTVVSTLQYNAVRGDCIREVTADADQQFRVDVTELIKLGSSNPTKSLALIDRMSAEAKINYADVVLKKCPPAIQKENP